MMNLLKSKINIIVILILLILIVLGVYKINRYDKYFIEENRVQMLDFCDSIIDNHDIFNQYDYMEMTVDELYDLSRNYRGELDCFFEMRERVQYFERLNYESNEYIAALSDSEYYLNRVPLSSIAYNRKHDFPEDFEINEEFIRMYKIMSELNEIYYDFLMSEIIDVEYYNETGLYRYDQKTSFKYWYEIVTELNNMTAEYLNENHISKVF